MTSTRLQPRDGNTQNRMRIMVFTVSHRDLRLAITLGWSGQQQGRWPQRVRPRGGGGEVLLLDASRMCFDLAGSAAQARGEQSGFEHGKLMPFASFPAARCILILCCCGTGACSRQQGSHIVGMWHGCKLSRCYLHPDLVCCSMGCMPKTEGADCQEEGGMVASFLFIRCFLTFCRWGMGCMLKTKAA